MPAISVIIPVLNDQTCLARAIQSARVAGASDVIVVDGNSRDQSTQIAEQAGCRLVHSDPGRGQQLDCGARAARGDALIFLHADAELSAECLQQVQTTLNQDASQWGCFEQRIDRPERRYRWLERGNAWRASRRRLVYGDQGMWMSRQVYQASGGFPRQPLMEDVVLSDRLREFGKPVLLPGPIRVSSRGWQRRGVVRQTLRNWALFSLYRCGVSSERIASWYY